MAGESFLSLLGYIVIPILVVLGFTLFIHIVLTLIRRRLLIAAYEDLEADQPRFQQYRNIFSQRSLLSIPNFSIPDDPPYDGIRHQSSPILSLSKKTLIC